MIFNHHGSEQPAELLRSARGMGKKLNIQQKNIYSIIMVLSCLCPSCAFHGPPSGIQVSLTHHGSEQHGFRAGRRIEEHLLICCYVCNAVIMAKSGGLRTTIKDPFCIKGGVRQGCLLSPRLFSSVPGSGPWMLASEGWQCWRGFSG